MYLQVHQDALDGKVNLESVTSHIPDGPLVIAPTLIGRDCKIARDCQIGPYTVLGEGCMLNPGAVVERSVCWQRVRIGAGATVKDSVIASDTTVADRAVVTGQSLTSAH